jgi:hypothetical protein
LQKYKSSGALKQNGQPSAVDLRSNGHGRTRAPWTAPCAWRTGPRWTAPFKRRGTRSGPSAQDLTALDVRERGATASTPECGGARQGLAGAGSGRRSRHLLDRGLEQNAVLVLAHVTKGSGGRSGLTGGRHRKGAARLLRRARGDAVVREIKGNWAGFLLTACRGRRRAQKRREGAGGEAWQRRRIGRCSGVVGARLPRASGTGTCDSTCSLSSWRPQESKRKGEGTNPSPVATN